MILSNILIDMLELKLAAHIKKLANI